MGKDRVSFNADSEKDTIHTVEVDADNDNTSDTMEVDVENKASDKNDDSDSDEDFDLVNPSVLVPDADIINMCDEDEKDGADEEDG